MIKVLFVCTGNICRSPTAEGLMRARLAEEGLAGRIAVDSAGTHGDHLGDPPDPRSIRAAQARGIDLRDLRARQVEPADLEKFDIIAVMEKQHQKHLLKICPHGLKDRVQLLMSFVVPERDFLDVPDPYYGGHTFEAVFEMIDQGVAGLLAHIRKTYPVETAAR